MESPDKAVTLPPEAYSSDELYAVEVERIFKRRVDLGTVGRSACR
ncbi:hypothetical protein ACGFK1_25950 [Mycobacterium sp. NPDC048908]